MSKLGISAWCVGCLLVWGCNSGGGSGGGAGGATNGGSGGSSSDGGSASGGDSTGGSATAGTGGTAPFTGRCAWPGTQMGLLKGVDRNNDVYILTGEELRRVRCVDGTIESDSVLATPWQPLRVGGNGLVVSTNAASPGEYQVRRFGDSNVLWSTTDGVIDVNNQETLVTVLRDPTTRDSLGVVGLNADGSERWKLDIPASHDFLYYVSRPGQTVFARMDADLHWLLTSLDPDGNVIVSDLDLSPAIADLDPAYPAARVKFVSTLDGTQFGITTKGSAFGQAVIDLQGNVLRKDLGVGITGSSDGGLSVLTSRGVLMSAWVMTKPMEGKTFYGGRNDVGVVALGAGGSRLWTVEYGTPGDDGPIAVNSDDYGELLLGARLDQELRVMRLDPQTGQEIGGTGPGTPCAGPTTFNGQLNTPCAPRSGSPTFECGTSNGAPVEAKCNTSTCMWEGNVCTGTSQCPAQCNGVTGCLGGSCGI